MNTQDNGLYYYLPFYNSVLTAKGDSSDISRSLITDTLHYMVLLSWCGHHGET